MKNDPFLLRNETYKSVFCIMIVNILSFSFSLADLRPDFRPGPSSTVAILGNDVVLECIPPKGNPIPEVGWEKDDEPIEETDRLQIMEDYNLMISSVSLNIILVYKNFNF